MAISHELASPLLQSNSRDAVSGRRVAARSSKTPTVSSARRGWWVLLALSAFAGARVDDALAYRIG